MQNKLDTYGEGQESIPSPRNIQLRAVAHHLDSVVTLMSHEEDRDYAALVTKLAAVMSVADMKDERTLKRALLADLRNYAEHMLSRA